jgi:hypothetical protein
MATGNRRRGPRPGGVGEYFGPSGEVTTVETCTCGHCQAIIDVRHRARAKELPAVCYSCQQFICQACEKAGVCLPAEQRAELEEYVGRLTGASCSEDLIARELETRRALRELGIRA